MWIRSQDNIKKLNIKNGGNLFIDNFKPNYCVIYTTSSEHIILGTYSSFKKAVKIINEISVYLKDNKEFQMPKDSEVE